MINRIVILGGGSAGWLTAGIIAARIRTQTNSYLSVILVESPDVPTIGVGEGTWPTMRTTLNRIGISETDFLKFCSASFKQGSKFVGWRTGEAGDVYYHPFTIPQFSGDPGFYSVWKKHFADTSFGDLATVQCRVCDNSLAPKMITTPEYAGVLNYGYHLDAGKFSELLKSHCINKLGVTHIVDHVVKVREKENGDISSLVTEVSGEVEGDLFIDCSGVNCLLLDKHYKIPFVDKSVYSCNDSALAAQVPYTRQDEPIASATIATAQSSGWVWDIGLSSRRGVGYVYSSSYIDDASAETELRLYLNRSVGKLADDLVFRKINFRPGHLEKFWFKNCVAIGMSAGFIEPLEASALALVELSANMVRDELPMSRDTMNIVAKRFNEVFSYRWCRIIDFLRLHYALSGRKDTEYWRSVTALDQQPESLRELLQLWRFRTPNYHDLLHVEEVFPFASYQYVLYGMGFETAGSCVDAVPSYANGIFDRIKISMHDREKYMTGLPANRDLLNRVESFGMKKI